MVVVSLTDVSDVAVPVPIPDDRATVCDEVAVGVTGVTGATGVTGVRGVTGVGTSDDDGTGSIVDDSRVGGTDGCNND